MFPDLDISPAVPPSMVRLITERVQALKARGATHILVQIPAEDFARTIDAVMKSVCYPFRPVLAGAVCVPWEKDFVGVMARADKTHLHPILFDQHGREVEEIK